MSNSHGTSTHPSQSHNQIAREIHLNIDLQLAEFQGVTMIMVMMIEP